MRKMKEFVLIFDLPEKSHSDYVKVWRDLNKNNAKKIQQSVWKSEKLQELIDIATFIKKSGGHAIILEEKLIF
jgi:antirestriction protein ArdC